MIKKKGLSCLFLIVLTLALLMYFPPLVFASTDTDLYVNADDGTQTQWTREGSTPYLDAQDEPTNYIHVSDKNKKVGDFSFPNLAESIRLTWVNLTMYCDVGTEKINAYMWDGASWSSAYEFTGNGWAWRTVNISLTLDTPAKINNTKVYFESKGVGVWSGTVKIDSCYLQVVAWFNQSWAYRKSHLINNATGAGINYTVKLITHYGVGSDSGGTVYLNNHSQTNFDDIRFTDNDGITLLDYWRHGALMFDSDNCTFWVKILENLTSIDREIYIYYGNMGASSLSNGTNTFVFFDDFESYNLGDLNGQGGWSVTGNNPTLTDVVNDPIYEGSRGVDMYSTDTFADHSLTPMTIGVFTFYGRMVQTNLPRLYANIRDSGTQNSYLKFDNDGYIDAHSTQLQTYLANTWYEFEGAFDYGSDEWLEVWIDGVSKGTNIAFGTAGINVDSIRMTCGGQHGYNTYFDLIFFRKYIDPEPTHGGWGAEEVSLKDVTFYNTTGGILRVDNATISNGTTLSYTSETLLELVAIVEGNGTYVFLNYTWDSNSNISNPALLTVTDDLTIWAYFSTAEEVAGYAGFGFLFLGVIIGLVVGVLVAFGSKR